MRQTASANPSRNMLLEFLTLESMLLDAHKSDTANKSGNLPISVERTTGVVKGKAWKFRGQASGGILAPKHKAA